MIELPRGWAQTTLGEILFFNYGKSLPKETRSNSGQFQVFGSNGVVGSHQEGITQGPALVIGRKGSIGEVHFSEAPCYPIDTTYFVDSYPATEPKFAYSLLKSLPLKEMNRSSAIPGLNREEAHALQILLPPLSEQRRIAKKLEAFEIHTTTVRSHLNTITKLMERYRRSVYDKVFSSNTNHVKLCSIARVGTGSTPKKGTAKYYDNGAIPWITSGAVNEKTVLKPSDYITETALKETNCKIFPSGSLLMAMYGEGKTRGKVARLGINAATNQALAVIHEIDNSQVDTEYLFRFLDSIYLEIREQAEGGVQPNLSIGKVKSFKLPLPSLDKQRDIVRRIDTAFARINCLATDAEKMLKLTERLDQRILNKAFVGQLVPQDPNDEPASVILERIRAGRTTTPKPKRQVRKKKAA